MLLLLRFVAWWLAILPAALVDHIGSSWGRFFGWVAVRQRRRADEHLAASLPELSHEERTAIRCRMFRNMGRNAAELLRWMGGGRGDLERRIEVVGLEHAREAFASGKGVIGLTAHLGNWDLAALWMASRYPLTILSKELGHKGLNDFWMSRRKAAGIEILPAHQSYRGCLAALRRGGMLGFILDQNMIRKEGIFVNFFGRPACTTPGMALLSAHAGSPILPIFLLRMPGRRYRVCILPPVPPAADRSPEALLKTTQFCTALIEEQIRQYPDQWIWMHRRWRTQPLPLAQAEKG